MMKKLDSFLENGIIISLEVTLNDPTIANGRIKSWLDGALVLNYQKIRNCIIDGLKIDSLYFDTYFGGPDYTWAPKKDEFVYFDNVLITSD